MRAKKIHRALSKTTSFHILIYIYIYIYINIWNDVVLESAL